jgi:hypothetical protein
MISISNPFADLIGPGQLVLKSSISYRQSFECIMVGTAFRRWHPNGKPEICYRFHATKLQVLRRRTFDFQEIFEINTEGALVFGYYLWVYTL